MKATPLKARAVSAREPSSEAGFTLVEALIAMVILMVGLAAISNLLIVSASSNTAANLSTSATTAATEAMEQLRAQTFGTLAPGTGLASPFGSPAPGLPSNSAYRLAPPPSPAAGRVLPIDARWQISTPVNQSNVRFIEVRAQMPGRFGSGLSLTEFTTFRACTAQTGCP
jgi:type II secretory pathway pseudopilin PulG